MKIAAIVDSASNLTKEQAQKLGLYFIPLYINIDGKEYADGIDINPSTLKDVYYDKAKTSTSASNLVDLENMFNELSKTHDKVIFYPISTELSSQYANAKILSQNYDNVYVVESKNICELIVLDLLNFLDHKFETEEDFQTEFKHLGNFKEDQTVLLIPKYNDALVAGGRLTTAAATLAKLFRIVPIISFNDGKLVKYGKGRVFGKVVSSEIQDLMKKMVKNEKAKFILLHSGNPEIEVYTNLVTPGKLKFVDHIPNVVAIHTGLEAIAMLVLNTRNKYLDKIIAVRK